MKILIKLILPRYSIYKGILKAIRYNALMSILLSIQNLNLVFGQKVLFNNAELTIEKGDRIGLIGLNGQGKSSLFNIITGRVTPDISTPPFIMDTNNELFDPFLIPQELNIDDYLELGMTDYYLVFYPELLKTYQKLQEDYSNADLLTQFEKLGGWEIQNSYLNYLKAFGLEDLDQPLDKLSGGEKRKMALSIGLSSNKEFILWDEPTNHLDIETIEKFEDELIKCKKTYMIISHDRYLLNQTTDRIVHIQNGMITKFEGTYLDYLDYLEMVDKERLKNLDKRENKHRRELAWMRQGVKARGTRSKKRVESFEKLKQEINTLKNSNKAQVKLSLAHSQKKSKKLIEIVDGSFSYPEKDILKNLNLMITKKDKIAMVGSNGAGKTTFINILREKLSLSSGKMKSLDGLKVVVFDQNRESLPEDQSPFDVISDGSDFVTLGDGSKKHINSYLKNFLFDDEQVFRPIKTLSGGEKNRLQLALFMKQSADLWIFDEPTNDLDIETIEKLENELRDYPSAVIIIGHDRAFLDRVCTQTWLIHNKEIEMFVGGYTQVAPYLDALKSESELMKAPPKKTNDNNKKKNNEQKANKKLKDLEKSIEKLERLNQKIDTEMANFNFNKLDITKKMDLEKLAKQKKINEKEISSLYEKWNELSDSI